MYTEDGQVSAMIGFGKTVLNLRTARNLSQGQLGKKVGVTRSAIRSYEAGDRLPSLDSLVALSRALGVTTDYLLGLSADKEDLLDVSGLTPEQITAIDAVVENFRQCNQPRETD